MILPTRGHLQLLYWRPLVGHMSSSGSHADPFDTDSLSGMDPLSGMDSLSVKDLLSGMDSLSIQDSLSVKDSLSGEDSQKEDDADDHADKERATTPVKRSRSGSVIVPEGPVLTPTRDEWPGYVAVNVEDCKEVLMPDGISIYTKWGDQGRNYYQVVDRRIAPSPANWKRYYSQESQARHNQTSVSYYTGPPPDQPAARPAPLPARAARPSLGRVRHPPRPRSFSMPPIHEEDLQAS